MAVRPPDKDQLAVLARDLGMDLDEADLESYRALVAAGFASYDAVEELYAQVAPEAPADREHAVPDGDEKPAGRLVRDYRHPRGGRGAAGWAYGGDQGQHGGRGCADVERFAHARR